MAKHAPERKDEKNAQGLKKVKKQKEDRGKVKEKTLNVKLKKRTKAADAAESIATASKKRKRDDSDTHREAAKSEMPVRSWLASVRGQTWPAAPGCSQQHSCAQPAAGWLPACERMGSGTSATLSHAHSTTMYH